MVVDIPKRTRKPKGKREPSPDAIEIAQRLYQAINAHSPDMFGGDAPADMEKRLLGWTLEIDRGLKAKDITVDDALLLIDYAHHPDDPAGSNGFTWHTNLLSGVAMRKQWKAKALLGKAKRWRDGKMVEDRPRKDWIEGRPFTLESIGAKRFEPDV